MKWLKVLRPRTTLMALLLCLVGFRIGNVPIGADQILAGIFIFVAGGFTMALNDWQDRLADNSVGRSFAFENNMTFVKFVKILAIFTILLNAIILGMNLRYGLLCIVLVLIACMYEKTRKISYVPGIYMGISSSMPVIFAILSEHSNHQKLIILFIGTMFYIYGRETLKDFEDITQDLHTKWTWPSKVGIAQAQYIIGSSYLITAIMFALIDKRASVLFMFVALAIYFSHTEMSRRMVKSITDIPLLIIMLLICIYGL